MNTNGNFELDGSFAIVMHGSITDANRINEIIETMTDLHVVYKTASAGKLYITEEKPGWVD